MARKARAVAARKRKKAPAKKTAKKSGKKTGGPAAKKRAAKKARDSKAGRPAATPAVPVVAPPTRPQPRVMAGLAAAPIADAVALAASVIDQITALAARSKIAKYGWKDDGGKAPLAYIKGMALVYAKVYCKLRAGDPAALEMAKARTPATTRMSWCSTIRFSWPRVSTIMAAAPISCAICLFC